MAVDFSTDGHVHTHLCNHAIGAMEEYVQAAIARGLGRIIFHEHLEVGISYFERNWLTEEDFEYYFQEGTRLKQRYQDRIKIGLGVEVGYNPQCPEHIRQWLSKYHWDRIGISYHYCKLPGIDYHLNFLSKKKQNIQTVLNHDASSLLSHYFETLIEAVTTIPAHVLCHLDAGLRHIPGLVMNSEHLKLISSLLLNVKGTGMALEVNTSGYETRDGPFPSLAIIKEALDLGIPLVAGSDAHAPNEVGRHFDRLAADLSSLKTSP